MSGESIVGILAAMSGIIGALFAGFIALRREKRDAILEDTEQLEAYRLAWLWSISLITLLRTIIRTSNDPETKEPKGIDKELKAHANKIARRKAEEEDQVAEEG